MSSLNYQQVSNSLIQNLSTQLARRTQGVALETLKQHHPKLAHALAQYSNSDLGVYYRTVGNARKECALLRFGHAKSLSGTLLTATDIKQPLYMPRYTSAIGFLITDPTKIHSIHDKLLLNPPANQTPEQIIEKRCSIVKALKAGNLQNRLSSIMIHGGPPRQDAVNESVINYEKTKIAAIIIPERTFNRSHGLNHLAKANTFTNNHCNALEEGRITAQLSYVTSKLGDLPILTFDGSQFKNLSLSKEHWEGLFEGINANAKNPFIHKLLSNYSDGNRPQATGLQTAMMEVNALEKSFDIHELKEVGGSWTSIPVGIARFMLRMKDES